MVTSTPRRASALHADSGRGAGDDGALAGQVDALADLVGGGVPVNGVVMSVAMTVLPVVGIADRADRADLSQPPAVADGQGLPRINRSSQHPDEIRGAE
jgi:hypothetical protein